MGSGSSIPFTDIYPDGPAAAAAAGGVALGPDVNRDYPGIPAGAVPIHRDFVASAAGTYDLWAPGAGARFVLVAATINVDAAGRVALVDDQDIVGRRIVDVELAANGGATPNMVPVPYPSVLAGNTLRLVTTAVGDTRVHVSGWLQPA